MDDYLDALYHYLTEERLPKAPLPADYAAQAARSETALRRLSGTFAPEQEELYLQYEDEYNGLVDLEFQQLFLETFRLAREVYR